MMPDVFISVKYFVAAAYDNFNKGSPSLLRTRYVSPFAVSLQDLGCSLK